MNKDKVNELEVIYNFMYNDSKKGIKFNIAQYKYSADFKPMPLEDSIDTMHYVDFTLRNGWTLCKDKLPRIDKWVLAYVDSRVSLGQLASNGIWYIQGLGCLHKSDVYAWMRLPNPPDIE